nr:flagellar motor switch protein FliN [Tepidanaerobacter sp. EBM-38]
MTFSKIIDTISKKEPLKSAQNTEVTVKPVEFHTFKDEPTSSQSSSLDLILDVPLEVTVELGRTEKTIKEILEISSGTIIELDKMAGEPADILVNGKLVAKGEVVVIDENFGVRITEIINSIDRVKSLQ